MNTDFDIWYADLERRARQFDRERHEGFNWGLIGCFAIGLAFWFGVCWLAHRLL